MARRFPGSPGNWTVFLQVGFELVLALHPVLPVEGMVVQGRIVRLVFLLQTIIDRQLVQALDRSVLTVWQPGISLTLNIARTKFMVYYLVQFFCFFNFCRQNFTIHE